MKIVIAICIVMLTGVMPDVPQQARAQPKPIKGSWVMLDGSYTPDRWERLVGDCADLGMEYLAVQYVAIHGKAMYPTTRIAQEPRACADPLETLLAAADHHGMKVFLSNGFTGKGESSSTDAKAVTLRRQLIEEIAQKYGRHKSFYGWYWPDEAAIQGHFAEDYIAYVNDCSRIARRVRPGAAILIAPYGTRTVADDARYRDQLKRLDVDIIAYQDEVGCHRIEAADVAGVFRRLRKIHDDVPRVKLWADMETFDLQGDQHRVPAFARVRSQIEALAPSADTILIYIYQGTMSKPGSKVQGEDHTTLYSEYVDWLKRWHPEMLGPALRPAVP